MLSTSAFLAEKARVKAARAAGLLDAEEAAEQIALLLKRVDLGGGGAGSAGGNASAAATIRATGAEYKAKGAALLEACMIHDEGGALRLISEGADVDFVGGDDRRTPLIWASYEDIEAVAARLVEAGAKLDIVDSGGNSALILASYYGHVAIARLLVARMDVAALNLVDGGGKTALDWAEQGSYASAAAAIRARGGLKGAELAARARGAS